MRMGNGGGGKGGGRRQESNLFRGRVTSIFKFHPYTKRTVHIFAISSSKGFQEKWYDLLYIYIY